MKSKTSILPLALSLFIGLGTATPLSYIALPTPIVSADSSYATADELHEAVTADDWYNRGYDAQTAEPARYQEAIQCYTKAIRLDPTYTYAYNNRGGVYYKLKQYAKAIMDFTETIRLEPTSANAYYNRGLAYYDLNQFEKAVRDYTETIRLDPNYADAYNNRGNAYKNLQQYEKAITD